MICSAKQSTAALAVSNVLQHKLQSRNPRPLSLPSFTAAKGRHFSLSAQKPLHLSSLEGFGSLEGLRARPKKLSFECEAYEADRSEPINIQIPDENARSVAAQKVKIGIYFATWWALNVVFNIYNKKVLNAFPYPWLTSTLSLAAGSLIMLISWATRIAEAPKTDLDFWKALAPVRRSIRACFSENLRSLFTFNLILFWDENEN